MLMTESTDQQPGWLANVPDDVWLKVFEHLSGNDLQVSSHTLNAADSNE